ncbi:MAG: monovalent cation/H(+) antiporter subunit G [Anaerolineae bacterium]|nr:monovalent cation/H(+) antiporter subunit G [Anaerolineae bacterium]
MIPIDLATLVLIVVGCAFFLAGTVGLLRFPDVYTRLHALTKADNVGLGLIVIGAALQVSAWTELMRLGLIWVLVIISSATVSHLIGRRALLEGQKPWEKTP